MAKLATLVTRRAQGVFFLLLFSAAVINHDGVDECIPISEIDLLASGGRKCVIIGQADVPAVVISG